MIIWEKWKDPLARLVNNKLVKEHKPDEDDESDPEYQSAVSTFKEDDDEIDDEEVEKMYKGPAAIGPLGVIPLHEANTASKLFWFWLGHSTFRVTKAKKNIICNVDGVESFDLFSPYRFRISVGKAFDQQSVLQAIIKATNEPEPKVTTEKSDHSPAQISSVMKNVMGTKYKFWAAVVKDGSKNTYYFGGETQEEVEQKIWTVTEESDGRATVVKSWER